MQEKATKKCCVCGNIKSVADFYKNRARRDGMDTLCKSCRLAKTQERSRTENGRQISRESKKRSRLRPETKEAEKRARQKPQARENSRKRAAKHRAKPETKEKQARYHRSERYKKINRKSRSKTIIHVLARRAVFLAIYHEKLPPAKSIPCSNCGGPANEYHHHNGYDEAHWLDVTPLCRDCHGQTKRL